MVVTFESVDEILTCDLSNEGNIATERHFPVILVALITLRDKPVLSQPA